MTEKVSVPSSQAAPTAPAPLAPTHPAREVQVPGSRSGFPTRQDVPGAGSGPQRVVVESNEPAPAAEQRPAWLPEKFKSPEDMAQAYSALEQRMGALRQAPATPATTPVQPASAEGVPQPDAASPAPAPAQGNADLVQRLTQEWATTGEVSAQARADFTQRTGLPDTYIDNQIRYLSAQNERVHELATKRLGGPEAVSELTEWAKNRLSAEDRATFNRAVYSGDQSLAQMALDGLAARYEQENGRAPRVIAGRKPSAHAGGLVPFQSNEDWARARKDPKYKEDPAYRDQVTERLALSQRMGLL